MSVVEGESLRAIVNDAQHLRWVGLSAFITMLWDHIICLDKEIELVWKRPWTRFTTLYMMIRYGAAVNAGFDILGSMYPTPSDTFCRVWVTYGGYSASFGAAIYQAVLAARVWALYGNSKRMFYVLVCALSASLVGMLTVWGFHTSFSLSFISKVGGMDLHVFVCHPARAAPYMWLFWVPPMAYDNLICFLAIYKGYRTYRANLGLRMPLMVIIVRDSAVYFIAISIAHITVLLMWLTGGGVSVIVNAPILYAGVMPVVLCCRLMLNLREGTEKPSNIMATQGAAHSEWSFGVRELPLSYRLDSMGLPRFSEITRVDNNDE